MFRALANDECDVCLVSETELPLAMSGEFNKVACEKQDSGEQGWEPEVSGCERDVFTGKPTTTRDCKFRNTGYIVLQVQSYKE